MAKPTHEIRDPIHDFIELDSDERRVLDSRPFQRLRHIHQLSLSYLVYPGASHRRFEHSLGVMEVATRIYEVLTEEHPATDEMRGQLSEDLEIRADYWKRVLRMAALCHDMGHLPFSHAPEKRLLPDGWSHERLTAKIILSDEMERIWRDEMKPPLAPMDIAKVAVGKEHLPDQSFNDWETILSEIITHDVFGADRMDYLLRDSYHAGVAYGDFDHYRLIDTLRILPPPPTPPPGATDQLEIEELTATEDRGSVEPTLGVEQGGLRTAEALLLARFFMYSEVYCHQVRRVYDEHLVEFLEQWLDGGMFSVDLDDHLTMTDSNVVSAIWRTSQDPDMDGHLPAKRIVERGHLKVVDEVSPNVSEENPGAIETLEGELADEFGEEMIWADDYVSDPDEIDFPVFNPRTENVSSALSLSQPLQHMPPVRTDRVYADDSIRDEVEDWLEEHRSQILEV